jgi:glycyl-tRNA synthetase beta chain
VQAPAAAAPRLAPLLVELFVEELPPKALKRLGEAFAEGLVRGLVQQGLAAPGAAAEGFASPRRLAVLVEAVAARADDRALRQKLMPAAVGLAADGTMTPALAKKLAGLGLGGLPAGAIERVVEGKAEVLYANTVRPGATLAEGLQAALDQTLSELPIPKVMTYQLAGGPGAPLADVHFVRPAHGLVALHGEAVVPVRALGLDAGRSTRGHRFEAAVEPIVLDSAAAYAARLRQEGAVIASFAARRTELLRQLHAAAAREGLVVAEDEALVDEVTALVERPNVLVGRFEAEFLAVPAEVLVLTMKANQKYFPLLDAAGALTNRFLLVSNITPADPARVIEGNQRVVRPRLADAKFFFDQDRRRTLESRVPGLAKVIYHAKLGTQAERAARVERLAGAIAARLAPADTALAADAVRAARLAKADLLSDMVGEFPELQGTMGAVYARHDGEAEAVALAIEDHYRPRFAGDALPRGGAGLVLALADKLETLCGLFSIGQQPTGDKDPFALRRHALGVVRMLVERDLPLVLADGVADAFAAFPQAAPGAADALLAFCFDRLTGWLREQGHGAHAVDAVLALCPRWGEIPRRLEAVRAFAERPEAVALAAANKRVGNLLKKSAEGAAGTGGRDAAVDTARLVEPAEAALAAALAEIAPEADACFERGDFAGSLARLAALRAPVDAFFDTVMVNADDPALRANRLALLARLHGAMNRVADLARLAA